jgi:hypothetical protein
MQQVEDKSLFSDTKTNPAKAGKDTKERDEDHQLVPISNNYNNSKKTGSVAGTATRGQ